MAVNCQSEDPLAEEQVAAASKEKVLDAVGEGASKLREKLGESLVTIKKFDVPLWLPAIQAQLALVRKNPTSALTALQPATPPIEFGQIQFVSIFPAFIRPTCAGKLTWQPDKAALLPPSFKDSRPQRHRLELLDGSSGASGHSPRQCLAGQNLEGQGADADIARTRALAAYKDFLTLWKDADPDVPILERSQS
jgi:hypothetical protein